MAELPRGQTLLDLLHQYAQRSEYQIGATAFAAGASATLTVRPAQGTILYFKMVMWDICPAGVFDITARGIPSIAAHGPFRVSQAWIDHNAPNWEEDPPQVTNGAPAEFVLKNQDSKTQVVQLTIWWWEVAREIAIRLGLVREF